MSVQQSRFEELQAQCLELDANEPMSDAETRQAILDFTTVEQCQEWLELYREGLECAV